MDHAIILGRGTGFEGEDLFPFLGKKIAQVPQINRIIINAQRAGISDFTICLEQEDERLKEYVSNDSRIDSNINWVQNGATTDSKYENSLVIPSNVLINSETLKEFINISNRDRRISVLSARGHNKSELKSPVASNGGPGSADLGVVYTNRNELNNLLRCNALDQWINDQEVQKNINFIDVKTGYWMSMDGDIESAERLIYSNVGKTATGWIARNINGRISLPISKHLIKTPLTPNMISVLINVIGMLSGPFYAIGHPVIGALFMQIATVLDRCDGEVARIKLMETKKGQWVDTLSDQITVFSFIVGVSIGYYLESGKSIALVLGGVNVFIFIFFLVWSLYFISRFTDSGSLVAYFEVDEFLDKKSTTLLRKFIAYLRPLSRRNVYSLAFLIFAIVGGYTLVIWVLTAALVMFFIHQVEDIIKILKLNKPGKS